MRHLADEQSHILSMSPPTRGQKQLAAAIAVVLLGALAITTFFSDITAPGSAEIIPIYAGVVLANDLITSLILLTIFRIHRSPAVLVLSLAYLFTGLTIIPWVLTFPGVFPGLRVLAAGLQSTAAIATLRLYGFPLFVIAYLILKDRQPAASASPAPAWASTGLGIALVLGLTVGSTWLFIAFDRSMPVLMRDQTRTSELWNVVLTGGLLTIAATFTAVWVRLRSALDLWLLVVLLAMFIERLLLGYLSPGRLSLGWWAGRIYGLGAASVVLAALLYELTTLYTRLVRSMSAERRAREARLMAMQALSASIAHEINQPLTSMVTNGEAGLRWLGRPTPDLDEVSAALRQVVSDGRRASEVIGNIRAVFKKGTAEQVPIDLNQLVAKMVAELEPELRLRGVQVLTRFEPGLPMVMGNPVQLQQVVANLVRNAAEAMAAVENSRALRIQTHRGETGFVLASFEDNGPGLDPRYADQVFEAVFTTKADGIGMGLVISRSIIEAHGGRIRAEKGRHGALFQFSLPALTAGAKVTRMVQAADEPSGAEPSIRGRSATR